MLAIRYILFALASTLLNLGFQYLSFAFYKGFLSLYIAMFFGTLAGLILKYMLDKKYIFFHTPKTKKDDGKKFMLYSLMGVFTTFIFWGFEIAFDFLFADENAKYAGALLGLSIGYIVKYQLDKKFVFKDGV
ncbi:MAG: GtrA family protein [Campylobacterales bacterium]|nr:GtrA family protein [Campylobacterales bacterium]